MLYSEIRRKSIVIGISACILLMLLVVRIAFLMLIRGKELSVMTEDQYTISEPISNIKYLLQDYNGNSMLSYNTKYYCVIDVNSFINYNRDTDVSQLNTLIYTLRNYNSQFDLNKLKYNMTNKRQYYELDYETFNDLQKITGIKGIYYFSKNEVNRKNVWRYENILTNPLTIDNKLKEAGSIEAIIADKTKNNKYPTLAFEKDVNGMISEGKYTIPENNLNVRLTTDKNWEDKIKEVISADKYSKYDQIGVALMESNTGKIKAMVQRDDWKPNIILGSATENGYEPGSIFKTIIEEVALEKDKSLLNKKILCKETNKQHGYVDMEEAYTVSCNTYFGTLGAELGFKQIYQMATSQGLLSKVLNFSGNNEVTGDIVAPSRLNLSKALGININNVKNIRQADSTETMLGIGQSMRITLLQALNIVNTVVNDGVYIKPYFIDSLVDLNGNKVENYTTSQQKIMKRDTARTIKDHMKSVVTNIRGTGKRAFITNMESGGKTGTNTRYGAVDKDGNITKYSDGWFIGYVKYNDRYYSMAVFVKDINVEGEGGGSTAAPIFKEVVNSIFNE